MKVWHGFTLAFWTILLQICFVVILLHYSLQGSVLNSEVIKERVAQNNTYEIIRDSTLAERVAATLKERYPGNSLVDTAMIQGAVAETFPVSEVQTRVEPVIDVFYQWLDSKRPDITFEVPINDRFEQFYRSLESRLGQKIASLPRCTTYIYPPEEAILQQGCLPAYVTATEATQVAMSVVRTEKSPIGTAVTSETVTVPAEQLRAVKPIPTYLNYLWALNYLMIGLAVLTILFLLIARRLHGVFAIGTAAGLAGFTIWVLQRILTTTVKPSDDVFINALQQVFLPPFASLASFYGLVAGGTGIIIILLATGWYYLRKRKHA